MKFGAVVMVFGYLDAGSGSLILQAILGGAAGIAVAFKAWKARLAGKSAVDEAAAETAREEAMAGEPDESDQPT